MNQPEAVMLDAPNATDPGEVGSTRFDAFVSYSHADRPVAAGVQKGLQRIARRMGRLNALRVFRDDTDLIATPDLFGRLTASMDGSRYLVVVLSPHAAASEWVNKEVTHWLERNGPDRMLMVLADGVMDWDEANGCLDPSRSDAAVPVLTQPGVLPLEPLWIDVSGDAPWDLRSCLHQLRSRQVDPPVLISVRQRAQPPKRCPSAPKAGLTHGSHALVQAIAVSEAIPLVVSRRRPTRPRNPRPGSDLAASPRHAITCIHASERIGARTSLGCAKWLRDLTQVSIAQTSLLVPYDLNDVTTKLASDTTTK
jgi:hypothetical protein